MMTSLLLVPRQTAAPGRPDRFTDQINDERFLSPGQFQVVREDKCPVTHRDGCRSGVHAAPRRHVPPTVVCGLNLVVPLEHGPLGGRVGDAVLPDGNRSRLVLRHRPPGQHAIRVVHHAHRQPERDVSPAPVRRRVRLRNVPNLPRTPQRVEPNSDWHRRRSRAPRGRCPCGPGRTGSRARSSGAVARRRGPSGCAATIAPASPGPAIPKQPHQGDQFDEREPCPLIGQARRCPGVPVPTHAPPPCRAPPTPQDRIKYFFMGRQTKAPNRRQQHYERMPNERPDALENRGVTAAPPFLLRLTRQGRRLAQVGQRARPRVTSASARSVPGTCGSAAQT